MNWMKQNVSSHRKYGLIVMIWEHFFFLAALFFAHGPMARIARFEVTRGNSPNLWDFGVMTQLVDTRCVGQRSLWGFSRSPALWEIWGSGAGRAGNSRSSSGIAFTVKFHQNIRCFSPWSPRNFAWKCQIPISLNEELSKQPLTSQHLELPPQKLE